MSGRGYRRWPSWWHYQARVLGRHWGFMRYEAPRIERRLVERFHPDGSAALAEYMECLRTREPMSFALQYQNEIAPS